MDDKRDIKTTDKIKDMINNAIPAITYNDHTQ